LQTRNLTWGGAFNWQLAVRYAKDVFCGNITGGIGGYMRLSKGLGQRPYYINSKAIDYDVPINPMEVKNSLNPPKAASTDWLNFIIFASDGCVFYLNKGICWSRFEILLYDCHYYKDALKVTTWTFGGMLQDWDCGNFYLTAGTQITGDLWDSPMTDLGPDNMKKWVPGRET